MRTHSWRALQSPGNTDLGILLMEGFFPAGCMPALSSVPSRAGCLCTVHPWTLSAPPSTPARRKTRICSTLGCQWQPETLGWEDSVLGSLFLLFPNLFNSVSCRQEWPFCASFNHWVPQAWARSLELCPVRGPVLGPLPRSCQCLHWVSVPSTACPPIFSLNSGMRNIHPCPFSKPTQELLHALVRGMGPVWLHALVEWEGRVQGLVKVVKDSCKALKWS